MLKFHVVLDVDFNKLGTHQILLHTYCPELFVNLNMERLTINIPETKSSLVTQILKELGVVIQPEKQANISEFRKKLANVSVWSDADLKIFEESKTAFENLKPLIIGQLG